MRRATKLWSMRRQGHVIGKSKDIFEWIYQIALAPPTHSLEMEEHIEQCSHKQPYAHRRHITDDGCNSSYGLPRELFPHRLAIQGSCYLPVRASLLGQCVLDQQQL